MRWFIGALLGGVLGAAIWGAVAYFLRAEFGWIAWAIGALVGWCAWRAADTKPSRARGLVAASVAIASIVGGKFAGATLEVQHRAHIAGGELTDAEARAFLANSFRLDTDAISDEAQAALELNAKKVWAAWSPADRLTYKEQVAVHVRAEAAEGGTSLVTSEFFGGLSFFDLFWGALSYATAFRLAARPGPARKPPPTRREEPDEPVRYQTRKWAA